ncbi:MAG TPA: hypothetical protein VFQ45_12990 [Longimicrobium sp.]|nr:hypothetical protein [Longimicrobium sp.]
MPAIAGLLLVALGLVLVLWDEQVGRTVWKRATGPEAGATASRVLGLILLVSGGVLFLTWPG